MEPETLEHLKISAITALEGKVLPTTGGGTEIGLMLAKGFAANLATVYISGRREKVLQGVHQKRLEILPLRMDVTEKEDIRHATKLISKQHGRLDVLVNK
ncbi:hypothetical protein PQX77_011123 [Marasmius sp. AFHP31]|nr:hypothetical protein PQX77_011123 [Marasmius sp. AFHP31]